ncbi:hypothetical protein CL621_02020 [archaeon]|nr:hypothetical protein [archaeon]|tara:strand:+ start:354 stop:602 length:249 start_codon:yes stop_codon:yes gene_type:complete
MNKNLIIIPGVILIVIVIGILAVAQTGNPDMINGMMGYKVTKGYNAGGILGLVILKVITISVLTFIVSLIFWKTHKWVMKKK